MKRASNYVKSGLTTFLCSILVGLGFAPLAFASGSSMYFSSAKATVSKGQNLTESIYIDTGAQQADTVNVVVKYDTSKLQYVSYSTGSSKFGLFPGTDSQSGGEVKWVGTWLGNSTTGKQFVGTITFKALASTGSDSLTMPGGNIARAGKSLSPTLTGATVNFTAPTSTPKPTSPPTSSGSGSTSKNQSNNSASTNPGNHIKTPKKVSGNVKLTGISVQYTIATLQLEGKDPTTASVSYGVSKSDLRHTTKPTNLAKSHSIILTKLLPSTQYFYKVTTKNKSGTKTTGSLQTFTTKGFDIAVTVHDKDGNLLKNKTIVLNSSSKQAMTNDRGVVEFSDVTPGLQEISYTADGHTYTSKVTVKNSVKTEGGQQTAPLQKVSVTLPFVQPSSGSSAKWLVVAVIVIVIILLAVFRKRLVRVFGRK